MVTANRSISTPSIGSVLAEHVWGILNEKDTLLPDPNDAYFAALEDLTVESWYERHGDQD